jgi:putative ABC transport system permease protein
MHFLDLDHWREILHALTASWLRTTLTAFGVAWGIFLLMIMLGSGNGLENGATQGFADNATNSFFVWTRSTTKPYKGLPVGRRFWLTNGDVEAVRRQVPEVEIVAPRNQLGGFRGGNNVIRGTEAGAFNVMGDIPEIHQVEKTRLVQGRFLNQIDMDEKRKVAVIGSRVIELLFEPDEDPIGESLQINGLYFKVVGTFESLQSGDQGDDAAQRIYVPLSTFQRAFNYGDRVGWLAITSQESVPASVAETKVIELLKRRKRVAPDDERALGHFNLEEEFLKFQGLFLGIRTLVWIVGIGTLAAGVIGVSNIMLVIIRERTREIGVRRAIGATPWAISTQIVLEAVFLTATAGYAGLFAGIGLIDLVDWTLREFNANAQMFVNPDVSLTTAMQSLAILVVSGTVAGLIPAQRAIMIRPVDALRAD